ncbi:MAG TPA: hypothetical protein VFC78_07770 [Tepidisphaeraceae bacterium]|nr:hypothetical protein [Tepidisphaeraceae bacterium]
MFGEIAPRIVPPSPARFPTQPMVERLEERRLLSAGAFDATFGLRGAEDPGMNANNGYAAVLGPAGGRPAALVDRPIGNATFYSIVRYGPNGKLARGFGKDGVADLSNTASGSIIGNIAALQPDGRILVVGNATAGAQVLRYTPAGKPDNAFGTHGVFTFASSPTGIQSLEGIGIQKDGKILVAGYTVKPRSNPQLGMYEEFGVARLTRNGRLDPTFGTDGQTITDMGGASPPAGSIQASLDTGAAPGSLIIQKDGRDRRYWECGGIGRRPRRSPLRHQRKA